MNREFFTRSTKDVLIHLKSFNYKLCRKGLLRRIESLNISAGDFNKIENNFLGKSLQPKKNGLIKKQVMNEFNDKKRKAITDEISIIESALSGLKKSVGRIKADVKSRVDSRVFSIW